MVKYILIVMCMLVFSIAALGQRKDTVFCKNAITPNGGLYYPRIKSLPSKYLQFALPLKEHLQIYFLSCISDSGAILQLRFLKAKKINSNKKLNFEVMDSFQLSKILYINAFADYLATSKFYPAGDLELKYRFKCKTILMFDAPRVKECTKDKNGTWKRKFTLIN